MSPVPSATIQVVALMVGAGEDSEQTTQQQYGRGCGAGFLPVWARERIWLTSGALDGGHNRRYMADMVGRS